MRMELVERLKAILLSRQGFPKEGSPEEEEEEERRKRRKRRGRKGGGV